MKEETHGDDYFYGLLLRHVPFRDEADLVGPLHLFNCLHHDVVDSMPYALYSVFYWVHALPLLPYILCIGLTRFVFVRLFAYCGPPCRLVGFHLLKLHLRSE
jgi:hypothetical protein